MSAVVVRVRLGARGYDVVIGRGVLHDAGRRLRPLVAGREVVACASARVRGFHGGALASACRRAGLRVRWMAVPDGERAKTWAVAGRIVRDLARSRAGRDACLVALGGGTTGDVAGFAASAYMRGIRVVQIPTTLEAQVDAAVGGKTAVDLPEGKNLAGAFHQPALVLADPDVLRTLPLRQIRAGLAEVVKYGVIASPSLFRWMERHAAALAAGEPTALERAVIASVRIKASFVSDDEREDGRRVFLNFGHTAGHALEAAAAFRGVLHGEAVAIGMACAARLSARVGLCSPALPARIIALAVRLGLPVRPPRGLARDAIVRAIRLDKKRVAGRLRVVLTRQIGDVTLRAGISPAQLMNALAG